MNSYRFQELLQKLSRGTILPEEENELREATTQLSTNELEKLFPAENGSGAWETTPPSHREVADSSTAYQAVWQQIQQENHTSRSWWRSGWLKAACLAGILALSAGLYFQPARQQQAVAWEQISTRPGEHRMQTMPDGTAVYMNGNSTIRYPAVFEGAVRQIQLVSGEIFLEVRPDQANPFFLATGDVKVKVLGTSFSVRNKAAEQEVSVAVKTGKVAFSKAAGGSATLLTPGEKGVYKKQEGTILQATCPTNSIGGWVKAEFEFEDATLRQILSTLEDTYGFHYVIRRPALAGKRFRAAFRGQTPHDMVRVLGKMGDFTYSIKDSTIVIQ